MRQRGITLIEMLIVVTLVGLMVGVSFPAVTSGVDSLRLSSSADAVAAFLNSALNRAERRQQVSEITIDKEKHQLTLRSADPAFVRELPMSQGVTITEVAPDQKHIFFFPGGTVPRITIQLTNRRGAKKTVRVDPTTGVPEIQ